MLTVLSTMPFLKDLMLAIEKYKGFATFLNNIDALNLAGAITDQFEKIMGYFLHTPRSV